MKDKAILMNELAEIVSANNFVKKIQIDIDTETLKYNLLLVLDSTEQFLCPVCIYFYDIALLNMKDIGGGLTQFMELTIRAVERGYDRLQYQLEEVEHDYISFYFHSAERL